MNPFAKVTEILFGSIQPEKNKRGSNDRIGAITPEHINALIADYGDTVNSSSGGGGSLLRDVQTLEHVRKWVTSVNKVSNDLVDNMFRIFLRTMLGKAESMKAPIDHVGFLDVVFGFVYIVYMIFMPLLNRSKHYALVTGFSANEAVSTTFPACNPLMMRFFLLSSAHSRHTMKGVVFIAHVLHTLGDVEVMKSMYDKWYKVVLRQTYIKLNVGLFVGIRSESINNRNESIITSAKRKFLLSSCRTVFKPLVAERFLPKIEGDYLHVPNILNQVVKSSALEVDQSSPVVVFVSAIKLFTLIYPLPKSVLTSSLSMIDIERYSVLLHSSFDTYFGWSSENNKDIVNVIGRVNMYIAMDYLKIVASVLALQGAKVTNSRALLFDVTHSICGFYKKHGKGDSSATTRSVVSLIARMVTDVHRSYHPTRDDKMSIADMYYMFSLRKHVVKMQTHDTKRVSQVKKQYMKRLLPHMYNKVAGMFQEQKSTNTKNNNNNIFHNANETNDNNAIFHTSSNVMNKDNLVSHHVNARTYTNVNNTMPERRVFTNRNRSTIDKLTNPDKQILKNNHQLDEAVIRMLDGLVRKHLKYNETFRPMLMLYVSVVNYIFHITQVDNILASSGFLEYKSTTNVNGHTSYIHTDNHDDVRWRVLGYWIVLKQVQMSDEALNIYKQYFNKIVLRDLNNAIKKKMVSSVVQSVKSVAPSLLKRIVSK